MLQLSMAGEHDPLGFDESGVSHAADQLFREIEHVLETFNPADLDKVEIPAGPPEFISSEPLVDRAKKLLTERFTPNEILAFAGFIGVLMIGAGFDQGKQRGLRAGRASVINRLARVDWR